MMIALWATDDLYGMGEMKVIYVATPYRIHTCNTVNYCIDLFRDLTQAGTELTCSYHIALLAVF